MEDEYNFLTANLKSRENCLRFPTDFTNETATIRVKNNTILDWWTAIFKKQDINSIL
jgi:hypothetical protein